ncbi:MAG: methyltransferase domain-containing protein [Gemmatimonadaceae bacterium]|nr:methyltransferase domain-containing protein [Gemmatimonadaceae bacterium]
MRLILDAPFTPRSRRTGAEVLDDPACPPALRQRSITDVTRANRLLGGMRAVLAELRLLLPSLAGLQREVTLLDVGTGLGDIPAAARRLAARHGVTLRAIGLDEAASLTRASGDRLDAGVCADARAMPFASGSIDVVTCSQVLHHFDADAAVQLVAEMDRVARCSVIVSDLRRSWLAAGGLWVVSFPMGFHPVSRADGMLSVLKGFTATELATLVRRATGARIDVAHRLGWRLTAQWAPRGRG